MRDLFDDVPAPDIQWYPRWMSEEGSAELFTVLLRSVAWQQDHIRFGAGKSVPLPRLTAWQGDPGAVYSYSGIRNQPQAWTPELLSIRERLECDFGARFNSVLLNRYRNGQDAIGWHADGEPELGKEPVIASISLGAPRTFLMRSVATRAQQRFQLGCGSLLIMQGRTQVVWQHSVPREPTVAGERINLTFRLITVGA